jgi:hypothetical protein
MHNSAFYFYFNSKFQLCINKKLAEIKGQHKAINFYFYVF